MPNKLQQENAYLWGKIAEMEQKQLKYLIELTEPKPEKSLHQYLMEKKQKINPLSTEQVVVGLPVTYYLHVDENGFKHEPFRTWITSTPWALGCGIMVCKVWGKAGGIALSHLEVRK